MSTIDPTTIIEEGAQIDKDVTIGPFCRIGANVCIGSGTMIASHCVIEGYTTIGKNNRIFSHAVLGSIPQDLKFGGEKSELIIGDRNTIREFTLFNPGTEHGGMVTKVGSDNLFMGYVHLGHDVKVGNGCILANAATLGGHVELGDNAVIGGLTGIHQFVKIGSYAMVGAGSLVTDDIPPYLLAQGNHAKLIGLNSVGLKRAGFNSDEISALKQAYKMLFRQTGSTIQKAKELQDKSSYDSINDMYEFILMPRRRKLASARDTTSNPKEF